MTSNRSNIKTFKVELTGDIKGSTCDSADCKTDCQHKYTENDLIRFLRLAEKQWIVEYKKKQQKIDTDKKLKDLDDQLKADLAKMREDLYGKQPTN